jgi:peptide/histidine transporter 3/4
MMFFRFFDKAAIVPSGNESTAQSSPWRLCTVTQVEELEMLLSTLPTWASFVVFYAVTAQMQ